MPALINHYEVIKMFTNSALWVMESRKKNRKCSSPTGIERYYHFMFLRTCNFVRWARARQSVSHTAQWMLEHVSTRLSTRTPLVSCVSVHNSFQEKSMYNWIRSQYRRRSDSITISQPQINRLIWSCVVLRLSFIFLDFFNWQANGIRSCGWVSTTINCASQNHNYSDFVFFMQLQTVTFALQPKSTNSTESAESNTWVIFAACTIRRWAIFSLYYNNQRFIYLITWWISI